MAAPGVEAPLQHLVIAWIHVRRPVESEVDCWEHLRHPVDDLAGGGIKRHAPLPSEDSPEGYPDGAIR